MMFSSLRDDGFAFTVEKKGMFNDYGTFNSIDSG